MLATTAIAIALAALLIGAGIGKLREPSRTAAAIDAYGILPAGAGRGLSWGVAGIELMLGAALLVPASSAPAAVPAVALFIVYAGLIARAVWRGDTDFDCGCSTHVTVLRPSIALASRNLVLAAAALAVALGGPRALQVTAWWSSITLALLLLGIDAMIGALIARAQWPTDD